MFSWSSTAVAQWHDLTMHGQPHYQRFLPSDHRHLCLRVGPAQQRGSQRQYWMSVARRRYPGPSCDLHPTSATKLSSILNYDHWGGTSPLHHPYTSACTLIGARQHRPFSSFTSPPSTPIFDKTSHPPPHTPNSFTFKRVKTPLTQSLSRVQTRITHSLSRAQA